MFQKCSSCTMRSKVDLRMGPLVSSLILVSSFMAAVIGLPQVIRIGAIFTGDHFKTQLGQIQLDDRMGEKVKSKNSQPAFWAAVVAQLVKRSLLTPEFRSSNPVSRILSTNCTIVKTEIKKKRPGMAHLKKLLVSLA